MRLRLQDYESTCDILPYSKGHRLLPDPSELLFEYGVTIIQGTDSDFESDTDYEHAASTTESSQTGSSPLMLPEQPKGSLHEGSGPSQTDHAGEAAHLRSHQAPDPWLHSLPEQLELLRPSMKCDVNYLPETQYTESSSFVHKVEFRPIDLAGTELAPIVEVHNGTDIPLPSGGNGMDRNLIHSKCTNPRALRRESPIAQRQHSTKIDSKPQATSRDRRRRSTKARAQYLRNRSSRSTSVLSEVPPAARADGLPLLNSEEIRIKHKHCAVVQEQELKCLFEDRAGTPHASELQPSDEVNVQLNVDELSVGGAVAALSIGVQPAHEPAFAITDIPIEEWGLK